MFVLEHGKQLNHIFSSSQLIRRGNNNEVSHLFDFYEYKLIFNFYNVYIK